MLVRQPESKRTRRKLKIQQLNLTSLLSNSYDKIQNCRYGGTVYFLQHDTPVPFTPTSITNHFIAFILYMSSACLTVSMPPCLDAFIANLSIASILSTVLSQSFPFHVHCLHYSSLPCFIAFLSPCHHCSFHPSLSQCLYC